MGWFHLPVAIFILGSIFCFTASFAEDKNKTNEKNYYNDEHRLITDVFKDYESSIRPAKFQNQSVEVQFSLAMVNLVRVDEAHSQLSFHTWVRMTWIDERLEFLPSNYSNIETIRVPSGKLWRPDIHLYNSAWGWGSVTSKTSYSSLLHYSGRVSFIPSQYIAAYCEMNLKRFPYDSHTCMLTFGSWSYDGNLLDLKLPGGVNNMDYSDYSAHDEWKITHSNAKRNVKYYPSSSTPYPDITLNITLTRVSGHYVHIFVAPAAVLSILIPFAFLLSPATGEKTYLCLGLIMAYTLLVVLLEDAFPSAQGSAPYLVQFYASCFTMTACVLILSQMLSFLWRARISKPPPAILDTLIIGCLGRLLFVERETYGGLEEPIVPSDDATDTAKIQPFQKPAAMMDWKLISTCLSRFGFIVFLAAVIVMDCVMLNYG
ncbi:neuronal acetylcholine receptor subunit alpha-3-like [Tubulanus polymorphus]|uniref:neuronal acetylcholine receptor subunit alpha-3-like n=1 Tax=Tubulanus polymorphus TaxID=672921 RepID=UPI003DA6ABE4